MYLRTSEQGKRLVVVLGVEYTKEQQLYRILVPSGHILLTFCVRIGTFDRSRVSGLVQVFSGFIHNCYKCSGPESEYGSLRMMATTVVKSWEVQRCWGTSAEAVVPVPQSRKSTVAKWYRYHSNRYRYPQAKSHQKQSGTGTTLTGTSTDM